MKVVLNKDIKGIGKKLQVVEVSEGYARNYLLPKNLAVLANNQSVSEAKTKQSSLDFKKQTKKEEAEKIKNALEGQNLVFNVKVGEGGKLFGSITSKEISEEIKNSQGYEIEKKKIEIEGGIKTAGVYVAKIKLYEGITAIQKIEIIGK